jgi:ABC-type bacteriocin/lantibiotic exporter with double-glycine peptidase domain
MIVSYIFLLLGNSLPSSSKEALRFQYVHEQQYDTSCGYAATSTLLDTYWGLPISEADLVNKYLPYKLEKQEYTVNLADITTACLDAGLSAKAFKMDIGQLRDALAKGYGPILVHYQKPDKHFALLLGYRDGYLVTADSARGMEALDPSVFAERWSGYVLLTASREKTKQSSTLREAIDSTTRRADLMERLAW